MQGDGREMGVAEG